jgi:hypothetical protein
MRFATDDICSFLSISSLLPDLGTDNGPLGTGPFGQDYNAAQCLTPAPSWARSPSAGLRRVATPTDHAVLPPGLPKTGLARPAKPVIPALPDGIRTAAAPRRPFGLGHPLYDLWYRRFIFSPRCLSRTEIALSGGSIALGFPRR